MLTFFQRPCSTCAAWCCIFTPCSTLTLLLRRVEVLLDTTPAETEICAEDARVFAERTPLLGQRSGQNAAGSQSIKNFGRARVFSPAPTQKFPTIHALQDCKSDKGAWGQHPTRVQLSCVSFRTRGVGREQLEPLKSIACNKLFFLASSSNRSARAVLLLREPALACSLATPTQPTPLFSAPTTDPFPPSLPGRGGSEAKLKLVSRLFVGFKEGVLEPLGLASKKAFSTRDKEHSTMVMREGCVVREVWVARACCGGKRPCDPTNSCAGEALHESMGRVRPFWCPQVDASNFSFHSLALVQHVKWTALPTRGQRG